MRFRPRRSLLFGIIGVGLAILACWSVYFVPPLLRGEHWYRGRPSSAWRKQVERYAKNQAEWSAPLSDRVMDWLLRKGDCRVPAVLDADPASMGVLTDLLWADDSVVRQWAAKTLGELGSAATSAAPALLDLIRRQAPDGDALDGSVDAATEALSSIGEPAIPILVQALQDEADICSRRAGARALHGLEAKALDALPALLDALQDGDPKVRAWVVLTLGYMQSQQTELVTPLWNVIRGDVDANVRNCAIASLCKLSLPPTPPVVALFVGVVRDQKETELVRVSAAEFLGTLRPGPNAAIAALIEGLQEPSASLRHACAESLGEIGPGAAAAIPSLRQRLSDRSARVRVAAALGLWYINRQNSDVVPVLVDVLRSNDPATSLKTLSALGALGPDAKAAAPIIRRMMNESTDEEFRMDADLVLRAIDSPIAKQTGVEQGGKTP
jgi:HEAT repeat protein